MAISAKNSLKNVHGFSPNQLVFGSNPSFPNVMNKAPPALGGKLPTKLLLKTLMPCMLQDKLSFKASLLRNYRKP